MKKLKKILQLSDPYPNLWYEASCYLKAVLGLILLILGFFFLFPPSFHGALGILLIVLGFWIFWQIKLVKKLSKTLFSSRI